MSSTYSVHFKQFTEYFPHTACYASFYTLLRAIDKHNKKGALYNSEETFDVNLPKTLTPLYVNCYFKVESTVAMTVFNLLYSYEETRPLVEKTTKFDININKRIQVKLKGQDLYKVMYVLYTIRLLDEYSKTPSIQNILSGLSFLTVPTAMLQLTLLQSAYDRSASKEGPVITNDDYLNCQTEIVPTRIRPEGRNHWLCAFGDGISKSLCDSFYSASYFKTLNKRGSSKHFPMKGSVCTSKFRYNNLGINNHFSPLAVSAEDEVKFTGKPFYLLSTESLYGCPYFKQWGVEKEHKKLTEALNLSKLLPTYEVNL